MQHLGLQPAPTICPFGAGNHSARQAYEIRPVVTVVGITIATFANAMLSYVVSVVVNNTPRARRAYEIRPVVTVVGITIATFANAMLSYVVSVVVNNNPRARQAFSKRPFLLAIS